MDEQRICQIDARCRRNFKYKGEDVDTWRSHLDDVRAGRVWYGDCDDLASTALAALGRSGLSLRNRYRLMVSSKRVLNVDHMVGAARDNRGILWVVGDTVHAAYRIEKMPHLAIIYQRMDRANCATWYEGRPQ